MLRKMEIWANILKNLERVRILWSLRTIKILMILRKAKNMKGLERFKIHSVMKKARGTSRSQILRKMPVNHLFKA